MKRLFLPLIFLVFSILQSCTATKRYHNNGVNIQWNWVHKRVQETGNTPYHSSTIIDKKNLVQPDVSISKIKNSSDVLVLKCKEFDVANNYCTRPADNFSGSPKRHTFFSKKFTNDTIPFDSLYQAKIKRLRRKTVQNTNAFLIFWLIGVFANLGGEVVLIVYSIYVGLPVFLILVPIIIITFIRYHYHKARYNRIKNKPTN